MSASMCLAVLACLGVDFGWRQGDDGRLEYIIQIRPEQLETLRDSPITSEIPPALHGVRRFVVQVGAEALPQELAPAQTLSQSTQESRPTLAVHQTEVVSSDDTANRDAPPFSRGQDPTPWSERRGEQTLSPPVGSVELNGRGDFSSHQPPLPREGFHAPDSDAANSQDWPFADATPSYATRGARPLAHRASHVEEIAEEADKQEDDEQGGVSLQKTTKPSADVDGGWAPLTLTTLLLFASLGGNAWLGWIAWGFSRRIRHLAGKLRRQRVIE